MTRSGGDTATEPSAAKGGGSAVSRRSLFGLVGAGAVVGITGFASGATVGRLTAPAAPAADGAPSPVADARDSVPFDGIHQAGIATPAQANLVLTAYDLGPGAGRAELAAVLREWTKAARALTAGAPVAADPQISVGDPAALTVTVGVGRALVVRLGVTVPSAFVDLPPFAGDALDPALSDGDVVVQLCADDPLVLAQADRVLTRLAAPHLTPRWQQHGFGSTGARRDGTTGRNLMGQLDGTNNVTTSQSAQDGPVWVNEPAPAWLAGGSYLVVRRIRMLLRDWDALDTSRQARVIGRTKDTGAPLGSRDEAAFVDLEARGADGSLVIPADAHVRHAAPRSAAENMMRRGYSYRGQLASDGEVDQGLLFLSYQNDPTTSFIPVQSRLAAEDALSAFTVTTASAVFAILPGTGDESGWLGAQLLS
uniref:Dyp-type peroxidase n=1 Tax=Arthrobacter globiformis TaxID=1665 RepID=B8R4M1_ARTGO|nr:hypothetical protein [Arthrobacter globiformis]